jgi:hypothetical protein
MKFSTISKYVGSLSMKNLQNDKKKEQEKERREK